MGQSTLKKTAYVAVGMPIDLLSRLRDRLSSTRETVDDMRDRLSTEAQEAFDLWVEEGERLISSLSDRSGRARVDMETRAGEIRRRLEKRTKTARDMGSGLKATVTKPVIDLDRIDGIGPSYSEKLLQAGVVSTNALVERASTKESRERLAEQTGINTALLEKWAKSADLTRVKGIGAEFAALLNAVQVATVHELGGQSAADLESRMVELNDEVSMIPAVPSRATIRGWIKQAQGLRV